MDKDFIAKASIEVNASTPKVWDAFINPKTIKQYMFGTDVVSDWKEGSKIIWKGEWKGKSYEDKGVILQLIPEKLIQYSHYSPMTGLPDIPENYHTVTIELQENKSNTLVSLAQDHNATEQEMQSSQKNWEMMLKSLKELLEKKS